MMEHTEAARTEAAERYVLGEMRKEEREIFEEHFFDCRTCAADVTDGMRLMANGRAVVREATNVVPIRSRWTRWVPKAAAAAFLVVSLLGNGYLTLVRVPQLAQIARSGEVIGFAGDQVISTSRSRAEALKPPEIRAGTMLSFDIHPPNGAVVASYVCEIRDREGRLRGTEIPVTLEQAKEPVSLLIGALPAGSYELVIRGVREDGNRFEITRSPFTVVGER